MPACQYTHLPLHLHASSLHTSMPVHLYPSVPVQVCTSVPVLAYVTYKLCYKQQMVQDVARIDCKHVWKSDHDQLVLVL